MSSSSFLIDARTLLVADASVVINLNATGCALEIIRALPNGLIVTQNVFTELELGARNGHQDYAKFKMLLEQGAVRLVSLTEHGNRIYASLVEGTALRTLDDGEAATIGYACEVRAIALIDERKAQAICARDFRGLTVLSTVDLLTHELVLKRLGQKAQTEAIVNALRGARMRVPPHHIEMIVNLIGDELAATCTSLPQLQKEELGGSGSLD